MRFAVFFKSRKKRARPHRTNVHYEEHKETARAYIHERIAALNVPYGFSYERIAIRNQRTRWGSCSARRILNFNYRLIFLPPHLADYVIVHELCHLAEMNHGERFWGRVAETIPDYRDRRRELLKTPISKTITPYVQRP